MRPKKPAAKRASSRSGPNWAKIAATPQFKGLVAARARLIGPACVFFMAYYFSLPILTGYFPEMMSRKVWGAMSLAYLFALSQFAMAGVLAYIYVKAAQGFDRQAAHIAGGVK